ncbi:hypothetical protein CVT24_003928 [Panaeolus cyanescens]|uniref:F-box domain-containing protein n=1 Tax=Panaeolus cyanescens TaxID=181874 RepID=A0A409W864_9AGAR|nr:hypothetical protein CVT24_003928 [Panaeolus cyanescens]
MTVPQLPLEIVNEIIDFVAASFTSDSDPLSAGSDNDHKRASAFDMDIDDMATAASSNNSLRSEMKAMSLVNSDFLHLCRPHIFREIDVGFGCDKQASLHRLRNLSKFLQDRPYLAHAVRSLTGVFPNPSTVPSNESITMPNHDHSLTNLLDLPNVTSINISSFHVHDDAAMDFSGYSNPSPSPYDAAFYGRDAILARYLPQITSFMLKDVEDVPLVPILSSPTLATLILDGCTVQRVSEIPSPNAVGTGFNLLEYHGKGTSGNSLFLLSLCGNLQRLYFDSDSGYQSDSHLLDDARLSSCFTAMPFNELTEAHFAGEVEELIRFYSEAGRRGLLAFPKLTNLLLSIDTDEEMLGINGDNALGEPHIMFACMSALSFLHLTGPSIHLLDIESCLRPCQTTLQSLRIDWGLTYIPRNGSIPHLDANLYSLSRVINSLSALQDVQLSIHLGFDLDAPKPPLDLTGFAHNVHLVFGEYRFKPAGSVPPLRSLKLEVSLDAYMYRAKEVTGDMGVEDGDDMHMWSDIGEAPGGRWAKEKAIAQYREWLYSTAGPMFEAQLALIGNNAPFLYTSEVLVPH